MSNAPELSPELFAQLWGEALELHPEASVHPGPACAGVARLAYFAGWEARGTAEDSSVVGAPPGEPIRTALERLLERLDETSEPGDPVIPPWIDSYAAARAALAPAPPADHFPGATKKELQEARREVSTLLQQLSAAQAPQPVVAPAVMEALTRLYWWGGLSAEMGYSTDVVTGVRNWIDGGMAEGLPPLPAWIADRCPPLLPPAAEGEVGGLVALVGIAAGVCAHEGYHDEAQACRTAAALLQQQAGELERLRLVPVAVSDRPWEREAGWLDPDGECWWCPPEGPAYWQMANPAMVYGGWVLPANALPIPYPALPLPSGEATNG